MYNFDETGFMMGKTQPKMVVTSSENYGRQKRIQPGNREWVTVIQGVAAMGRAIPPFVIFAGKVLIDIWFHNLPRDWILEVSPNGWTNNRLALAWLEHFDKHSKQQTVGYRLLIIDGHESHCSVEFQDRCKEKNIILLCMPPHSSHLLQPLDVACFSLLKRAYGDAVSTLARDRTHYISKDNFLPAFKTAFEQSIIRTNISAGFRGAGLVPHNPEAVLMKLDVRLCTPPLQQVNNVAWEARTPCNASEFEAQSTLIRNKMRIDVVPPARSLEEKVNQLSKGAQQSAHEMVLMKEKIKSLEEALDAATKRKSRKRRYIRTEETATVGEVLELIAQRADGSRSGGESVPKRVRLERRCGRCKKMGHNSRTRNDKIRDASDSEASYE